VNETTMPLTARRRPTPRARRTARTRGFAGDRARDVRQRDDRPSRSMPFERMTNVSPAATRARGSAAFVIPSASIEPKLPVFAM
jgi:hypothetical protein